MSHADENFRDIMLQREANVGYGCCFARVLGLLSHTHAHLFVQSTRDSRPNRDICHPFENETVTRETRKGEQSN